LKKGNYVVLHNGNDQNDTIVFHNTCFNKKKDCKSKIYFLNVGCHTEYLEPYGIWYQQILSYGNTICDEVKVGCRKVYKYNVFVETVRKTIC
jgi:hypothetical protein